MSIAYLLVGLGLAVFAASVWAMLWAIDSGQYDEVEKHGADALEEDPPGESSPLAGRNR